MVIQDLDTVCSLVWRSFLVDDQLVAFERGVSRLEYGLADYRW